ncbi:MAG: serine hydrolase [Dehalococcoidia bacterium]
MRRAGSVLALSAAVFGIASCGQQHPVAIPHIVALSQAATPHHSAVPVIVPVSPTEAPSVTRLTIQTIGFSEHSLADLSPAAALYATDRTGQVGVAVVVPSQGIVYTANGDAPFPMASVAKVAIMVAVLDQTMQAERDLTDEERELIKKMIVVSDNDAAQTLWDRLGGGDAVDRSLKALGLSGIQPYHGAEWGASVGSARAIALLLEKLATGQILDESRRAFALDLMQQVAPDQSWGVTAGVPTERTDGTALGIKDGWYLDETGWWVNSVGIIPARGQQPEYMIAVLTRDQPGLEYGIETIEWIASIIQAELHL